MLANVSINLIKLGDFKFNGFNMQFSPLLITDGLAKMANISGHS